MTAAKRPPRRELISAPAGTGKTRTCIEVFRRSILERTDPFSQKSFFILPNQEHAARINDLLLRSDGGSARLEGMLSPAVLTINQFIQRFAGIGAERTPGDMLKHFFLNEILREGGWKYFNPDFSCGLVPLLGDFLRETKAAFLSASDFEERARPFVRGDARGDKFADLIRIFHAYEEKLNAAGLEDAGDLIRKFVQAIPSRAVPALDLVILDGFYHFTRAQIEFVKTVTRIAGRTIVTLTRDPARGALFEFPERTRSELMAAGFAEVAFEGSNRRALQPALAALEKNLFLEAPEVYSGPAGGVTVFEAAGASGEIEMIAREVQRLYRETGYHYSDFCLVFRSIGPYEGLIQSIFRDFEIPVEVHERKRLKANALIRAFDRWLGLLADGWKREDFLALLSSHYYACPEEAVRKIAAVSFERGWLGGPEEILRLAAEFTDPEKGLVEKFTGWYARMAAEKDSAGVMRVLKKFLEEQGFNRRRAETDEAAREDHQAYRTLLKLLDEIGRQPLFNGGESFDFSGCVRRLREAIDLSLFSLPSPDKNRVQVYDIAFALQKEYRVVFVAGLLEKAFPQRAIEDPVLKDDERRLLNGRNPAFEERLSRAGGERYFFYMAVSRARERLYLTYPRFDLEAKETLPSFYAEEVKKCFSGSSLVIRGKQVGDVVPDIAEISRPGDLYQILNGNLFAARTGAPEDAAVLTALYNVCIRQKDYQAILDAVKREPEAAALRDPEILARFRGLSGPFSPTRLELFATCPFKYFAAKTLKLQEERDSMDSTVLGSILHKVLEEFYSETAGAGKDGWILLKDPEAAKKQLLAKLEDVLSRPEFRFGGAKKFRQDLERARLAEMLEGFVEAEHDTETGRATHPRYFEQAFGMGEEGLPALEIGGEEPVALQGKIDRIDWDAKTGLAVVVDYKRGASKTDRLLEGLEKGVALQLPIYLLAARKLLGARPAAAELYPLMDPARRGGIYHRELMASVGAYRERYQGAMSGEEFDALLKKIEETIPAYVARLREGDVSIRSKGCDYCPYGHLCRFEKWKLIYSEEEKIWTKKK